MSSISEEKTEYLQEKANAIRATIIEMLMHAGSGHTAGPLGMADIFTALYFHVLNHDPSNPLLEERDRLVLSAGHIVPVRYAAMAHAGYFPISDVVEGLRMFGSPYQGHPERVRLPALETTSGPLGSGLGQAAGIALALRMDKRPSMTYCVMSDGEQQAGNTWEAAMFAGVNQIGNLTAIIDSNNIQINGFLQDVMPIEPLRDKYESFGWHVIEVDGHNIEAFVDACEEARAVYNKPSLIIAHTIPGKGVRETEFDFEWHGKPPTTEEGEAFLKELRTLGGRIHNTDVN